MVNFSKFYQRIGAVAAVVALQLVLVVGCAEPMSEEPPAERPEGSFSLVEQTEWIFAESDDDPFLDRPAEVRCPTNSWGVEELDGQMTVAVSTEFCDYFTVMQPTREDVWEGDSLTWRIFHFALEADSPATAHVALRIGSQTLVDEEVEIPSESALIAGEIPAAQNHPEGTPIFFHVHNHGANEYSLIELSAEAP